MGLMDKVPLLMITARPWRRLNPCIRGSAFSDRRILRREGPKRRSLLRGADLKWDSSTRAAPPAP